MVGLAPSLAEVGVLLEPTTVVTKAWAQVQLIGERSWFEPHRVLVTGAGGPARTDRCGGRQPAREIDARSGTPVRSPNATVLPGPEASRAV